VGRHADSNDLQEIKKRATKEFIYAVENGGTPNGPKLIEKDLGIGDQSGSVWCTYRRGVRSWPIPSLMQKIERAKICGYISEMMARELISKLPSEKQVSEAIPSEPYTFNATRMYFVDIMKTVGLLENQIQALSNRAPYGIGELENAHYLTTSIDLLEPIQRLIQKLTLAKQAEELRLKEIFGKENYKDIAPSSAPKNASAYDVGYTPDWWMRSPPSESEINDEIRRVNSDEVINQRKAFIKKFGGDGF
jgi:hypothetical protein